MISGRSKRARGKSHLGRPRGASSAETRARVLAAARACFARTGYAATTTKQIADEAGLTTASIYLYFESKMALYVATVRDAYAQLLPHYRAAAASATSVRDGFRALLAASRPIHQGDPSLAAFLSAMPVEMRRHEELARAMSEDGSEVAAIFLAIVERGVRAREIPAREAPYVLALFIACTMGLSLYVSAIDGTQFGGMVDAFNALLDGELFRRPKRRARRR